MAKPPPPKLDPKIQAAMSNMRKQLPKMNKPGGDGDRSLP